MKRLPVILLLMGTVASFAIFAGWNRTAADDQSADFRLSQIMVKLTQIEWELSRVKNRLGTQDQRFDRLEGQLDRILEEIEDAGSEKPPSSATSETSEASTASESASAATDPALAGTWRLARHDFTEDIPESIRRYLAGQAIRTDRGNSADRIDERVKVITDRFAEILEQAGLLLIRFSPDGLYTDGTGDEGMWLVSDRRLILTSFDGRAYPFTYAVNGADLTLTITGDQIDTLFRLEAGISGRSSLDTINNTFKYTDRVRLFYSKDF